MFLINLKHIFRNLWSNKVTSSVNILGFAFSLSICFIIGIYVLNEFSYDKFHKNYNNIYRVVNEEKQRSQVDYTIRDEILKEIPEVNQCCHLLLRNHKVPVVYQNKTVEINNFGSTDNSFFNLFSFPLLAGNQNGAFDKNNRSVLIAESLAMKLFEKENPLGKNLKVFNRDEYTICGVFKDFPKNSSIYADLLFNETYQVDEHTERYSDNGKQEIQRTVFLTINKPSQVGYITEKINHRLEGKNKILKHVWLQPLKDMYLFDNTKNWGFNKGNYQLIKLFIGIAIITLILASINYINLSIAQYSQRSKETGVRKTLGAGRLRLIRSFLSESVVVTLISLVFAFLLTFTFLPLFNSLFSIQLKISALLTGQSLFVFIFLIFVFSLINGIWPALLITSFNPVQILQKRFVRAQGKNTLKNILTTTQFAASIALIMCVLLIIKQLHFIKQKELGFNDNYLLKLSANHITKFETLKNKLLQNPSIINASYSSGIPGEINYSDNPGTDADFYKDGVPLIHGDASFIKTFEVDIIEGRDFLESENKKACIISETALNDFGWENNWKDKYFQRYDNLAGYQVVGVFKDFHFRSMYRKIQPLVIEYNDKMQNSFLTLRVSGRNISGTLRYINNTWNEIEPEVPIDLSFYDTFFDSMYQKEEQLSKMVSAFAVLAIIISCLGIFGQSILNTINRMKEIGIRKVNGAKASEVMAMLNKDLIKWVVIAFVVATPVAWYAMNQWLEGFAYKTGLSWWVFILAGTGVTVVALLTVSWQSWKVANINPSLCLKDE